MSSIFFSYLCSHNSIDFLVRSNRILLINNYYHNLGKYRNFTSVIDNKLNYKCYHTKIIKRNFPIYQQTYFNQKHLYSFIPNYTVRRNLSLADKICCQMSANKNESELRDKYKPRELKFKTPFGHVACLEWGKRDAPKKVLCMHGWLDNAGSFERLIPFILDHNNNHEKYHIVAMDQPGVGLSSHRPLGADYTTFSLVMEMRRITQQLEWEEVVLLSHSLGSHISFLYSCVYPKQTKAMISIDLAHPITRQTNNWNITIANSIDDHFKCEYHHEDDPTTNIRVPVYSKVDALKRLMAGHSNSLTEESAEVLLKRGAKKQSWGYTFVRDIRLRHFSLEFRPDDDLMLQYLSEPFHPSLFIIRANQSPYHRPEEVRLKYYELFKKNCPFFRDVKMDGTHHLHMNTPDKVAEEINKFLDDLFSVQPVDGLNRSNL